MRKKPQRLQGKAEIDRLVNGFGGKMLIDHGACSCCIRDEKVYKKVMERNRKV